MFTSSGLTDLTFPDLHNWSLLTGGSAGILVLVSVLIFLWNLLHSEKTWWHYGAALLLLGIGCWSLSVAFSSYQQWVSFEAHLPHSPTEDYLRTVVGPIYWADVQHCQLLFASGLALVVIAFLWWLISRFGKERIPRSR
jgi:hypothetical protein